jgi:hypothetical protein
MHLYLMMLVFSSHPKSRFKCIKRRSKSDIVISRCPTIVCSVIRYDNRHNKIATRWLLCNQLSPIVQ